jgi:hypothetical protein
MNILIKIFLTYSCLSMVGGLLYAFSFMSGVVNDPNLGYFIILWLGPLMIALSIGGPIVIYKTWNGDLSK